MISSRIGYIAVHRKRVVRLTNNDDDLFQPRIPRVHLNGRGMKILQRLVWIKNGQYLISINNIDMEISVGRDFLLSIFNSYKIIKNQFLSSNAYYSVNILSTASKLVPSILFQFHSVCGTFENVLETHTISHHYWFSTSKLIRCRKI